MHDPMLVQRWFGAQFSRLHPQLQALHQRGGRLVGVAQVTLGQGKLAQRIGRRLAQRMGMPHTAGPHDLQVNIWSDDAVLHWDRCFDGAAMVHSSFQPVGQWPNGHWVEKTGPLQLTLTVEVGDDGAWIWKPLRYQFNGWTVPLFLVPRARALKRVVNEQYVFEVSFSLPGLGLIYSYSGALGLCL